nr:gephyrin-like molybdotransferase Glp [Brevundimonas variabilis]
MPTVEDALAIILDAIQPLPFEMVAISEADGRWLTADVLATRDQPPFDASAMDGWAMQTADVAPGAVLTIVGESAAGRGFADSVGRGQTVRISTGAPLPSGADHVVIQEDAERQADRLFLRGSATAGHIRRQGCDFVKHDRLLAAGIRLNPWQLALAASAGAATLTCGRKPVVAILATGDELVEPGQSIGPDQIFNAGAPALAAFTARHAATPIRLASAADTDDAIIKAVTAATFDVLVTIGGASVGDHDRVKPALRSLGATIRVEGVAMRPGKPVWFATLPDCRLVLGLPGNPASALVCAELFLAPILARLQGATVESRFQTGFLTAPLAANGPRDHYLRARATPGPDGRLQVTPFPDQDSSLVTVMAAANALIRRQPHASSAEAGAAVSVLGPTL